MAYRVVTQHSAHIVEERDLEDEVAFQESLGRTVTIEEV